MKGLTGNSVLLVVEIADSSLRFDIGRKAAPYAGFGVRELWVVDAVRLSTRVFQPSVDGYREIQDFAVPDRLVPLVAPDAFALRLTDLDMA